MRMWHLWALQILILTIAPLAKADPPIFHRVEVFHTDSAWTSVGALLEEGEAGKYVTKEQKGNIYVSNCEDLLDLFQRRPLDVMERNAYITPELKSKLRHWHSLGIKPKQVILVTQFSKLSETQAQLLFPDPAVLEERTMKGPGTNIGERWVIRGSMWAIRGFEIDETQSQVHFNPAKLPWESGKLADNLARPFDRSHIPFIYEIGRTLSEKKPLPGDVKLLSTIMTSYISNDADVFGLDPNKVMITAHALDSVQARVFSLYFPFRFLDKNKMEAMENNATDPLANYMQQDLPTADEWKLFRDVIAFGSLQEFKNAMPVESITVNGAKTKTASFGIISPEKAQYFWRDFQSFLRRDYDYDHPQLGRSPHPLIVIRSTQNALFIKNVMSLLAKAGIQRMDMSDVKTAVPTQRIFDLLPGIAMNPFPDGFTPPWVGPYLHLHPGMDFHNSYGLKAKPISHFVLNLDVEKAKQFPRIYLASVILGIRDELNQMIAALEDYDRYTFTEKLNEDRKKMGMAPAEFINADVYFNTYGLALASSEPYVNEELALLGGTREKGLYKYLNSSQVGAISVGDNLEAHVGEGTSDYFNFKTPQIKKIMEMFPYLAQGAGQALKPMHHDRRLKLIMGPNF